MFKLNLIMFKRNLSDLENGGFLFLGGSDPNFYSGELFYVNLTETTAWVFQMDSVYVDNVAVCSGGCQAFTGNSRL